MNDNTPVKLNARDVSFGFVPGSRFLGPVSAAFHRGSLTAVVGPNGAGKSTLLRLLVGLLVPESGDIEIDGRSLSAMTSIDRARKMAFLPQHPERPTSSTAEELVRLGRHPHRGWGIFETPADVEIVRHCMRQTETLQLACRRVESLSGGEAQRVQLAAALAQQPEILALDEPTSDLDLRHQIRIYRLLEDSARHQNLALVVVTHDLNLAAKFADRMILMHEGQPVSQGSPNEVLCEQRLEQVYGVRFQWIGLGTGNAKWLVPFDPSPGFGDA